MAKVYPQVAPIRVLRYALSQMRLSDLEIGIDGRNRTILSTFRSRTGRNQPSNTRFIFGPAVWLRGLIRPEPGFGLAYIDWSQQEFGIAAAPGTLTITHSLWRGRLQSPKTEACAATIRISSTLSEILEQHKQQSDWQDPNDFVFSRSYGSPLDPDFLRKEVLYPALDAAGITRGERSHGFHLFRHSAGSIIHAATEDLKLAQEQLRHTQISTTSDIYVHLEPKVAQKASNVLAEEIFPNCVLVVSSASDLIH